MTDETATPQSHHEPSNAHDRDMEGPGGHVDEHMSDDHGHGDTRLGPIDWGAWGYAALGLVAGLVVVFAFLQAVG